ncbi:MAG: TMEM165/GDT1 family protein [Candidatus Margulisiibacteriota bacterium]
MNLWPLIITFFIIGAAELGDKTQLLTLGFAARYSIGKVVAAVFLATALVMALAVFFGEVINYYVPTFYVQLFTGILFVLFGLWILRGEKEEEKEIKGNANLFWIVFASFLFAELGDKTQLATFALSAKYGTPFQVWLGATLGMAGVNSLGALIGGGIKKHVSENLVKWVGALVFIVFGLVTLGDLFIW